MSAANTGTPAAEKPSAITCSETVLPVPVAPVTRPWRLASLSSRHSGPALLWPRKILPSCSSDCALHHGLAPRTARSRDSKCPSFSPDCTLARRLAMHGCMSIVGITWPSKCAKTMGIGWPREWATNGRERGRLPAQDRMRTMAEADVALAAEFEPATREAWLTLVEQGAEGRRLREAAGVAHRRWPGRPAALYARRCRARGPWPEAGSGWFPGGWDMRQRHAGARSQGRQRRHPGGPDRRRDLDPAADQRRRGRAGSPMAPRPWPQALEGVFLDACTIALDARENTLDAAGSLLEIWREEGISENERRGAFNYDPLGVLARDRHALLPGRALLRDRRQARGRFPLHVARDRAAGRRAPLSRSRRQRGAGAGGHAGDARGLPARLRGGRASAAHGARPRSRSGWLPMRTCSSP